jgi:hypothetical protein
MAMDTEKQIWQKCSSFRGGSGRRTGEGGVGTLEISYWGITRSRMLGSYGGCTTRITWSKISWPTRRYYLGDFEELMRALRELEIGV